MSSNVTGLGYEIQRTIVKHIYSRYPRGLNLPSPVTVDSARELFMDQYYSDVGLQNAIHDHIVDDLDWGTIVKALEILAELSNSETKKNPCDTD